MKKLATVSVTGAALLWLVSGVTFADPIADGTMFGLDFGPTPTNIAGNDWVETDGAAAIGSITDLGGTTIDDVSVSFSITGAGGFTGANNDGPNADYAALLPGTAVDPNFVESVVTDILFRSGGTDGSFITTVSGLDDNLLYDVVAVSAAAATTEEVLTINGESSSITRGDASAGGATFHSFSGLSSTGGVLTLDFTQFNDPNGGGTQGNNPIVNGILFTARAVPEPASIALWSILGIVGLSYAAWRRRKHR